MSVTHFRPGSVSWVALYTGYLSPSLVGFLRSRALTKLTGYSSPQQDWYLQYR
jgi:hypothetical protein